MKFIKKHSAKIFFVLFFISFIVAADNIYDKYRMRESIRRRFSNALSAASSHIYLMDETDKRQTEIKNFVKDAKLVLDITYFAGDNALCHDNRKNLETILNYIERTFCNNSKEIKLTHKKKEFLYNYLNKIATYPYDQTTSKKVIEELESIECSYKNLITIYN
ncbi:hypothetical protein [Hathewaya limosa]|uniref:Lipoprotein n=1 Tax=Hathewaya limosa TaxID=1536 RepID=A0ABU0JT93_HATLI|nr:hypothetical protein [Hathewaya limosa]MDQ0480322.1 hypothetical protein [Hathewaya limosa]